VKRKRWSNLWPARFIGRWEGLLLRAYLDTIASPPVWTIGYGWTGKIRDPKTGKLRLIRQGDKISATYAARLLSRGLRTALRDINLLVKVPITVRQRMALMSLWWNIGPHAFATSTLLRKLNKRDYRGAADEFPKWKRAGGVTVEGLLNRRRSERRMFLSKMPQPRRRK
jgi:GH24 family phage-related lysozyme (muramidase)